MAKLWGRETGKKDMFGNRYVKTEDGYFHKADEYNNLHETRETTRLKEKKAEAERQRAAQPGFFDDLPTFSSLLSKNIAEENQRRAMKKAQREQKINAAVNTAVTVGGIVLAAAKEAGHAERKEEPPVRSKEEYREIRKKLYGR